MDITSIIGLIILAVYVVCWVLGRISDVCSPKYSPEEKIRRSGKAAREKMDRISAEYINQVRQILNNQKRR